MSPNPPVCKICGVELLQMFDKPPEYSNRCNPSHPRVTLAALEVLTSVPSAYRRLVELDLLHDFSPGGDVEFLSGDALVSVRQHVEVVAQNGHLQPFAQTACGDLWCWTTFRTGISSDPEILLVEDSLKRVVVYAPSFQSFLYRGALEDASGRWEIAPDELPSKISEVAEILRRIDFVSMADDLDAISLRPVQDYTPVRLRAHGLRLLGLLPEEEVQERINRFLIGDHLQKHTYDFLRSA